MWPLSCGATVPEAWCGHENEEENHFRYQKRPASSDSRKDRRSAEQTLADLSDLYSQTKQAHWNVRGRHFYSLHKLFDELAETVEGHIDPVAERITALGGIAHGTVRQAAAQSSLPEFPTDESKDLGYVDALLERFAICADDTREAIDDAAGLGDADTADLLTAVSRDLDQGLWFLEAHTRQ